MSSLMLLLVWLIFFMVLIKLLPILGTISVKTVKLMELVLICLGNNRQECHPPNCMLSWLQILEASLWFVLITLLNVTLIILFSSRRRHTRFDCDWSSDVCSSDLEPAAPFYLAIGKTRKLKLLNLAKTSLATKSIISPYHQSTHSKINYS